VAPSGRARIAGFAPLASIGAGAPSDADIEVVQQLHGTHDTLSPPQKGRRQRCCRSSRASSRAERARHHRLGRAARPLVGLEPLTLLLAAARWSISDPPPGSPPDATLASKNPW